MENHILRPVEGNPLAFKTANNKASSDEKFHSYINFKLSNSPGSEWRTAVWKNNQSMIA